MQATNRGVQDIVKGEALCLCRGIDSLKRLVLGTPGHPANGRNRDYSRTISAT